MPQVTKSLIPLVALMLLHGCTPHETSPETTPDEEGSAQPPQTDQVQPVAIRDDLTQTAQDVFCLDQLGAYMTEQPPPTSERYADANRVQLLLLAESALEEALLEREMRPFIEALPPEALDELYGRVPPLLARRETLDAHGFAPDEWSCLDREYVDRFVARRAALEAWTETTSPPLTTEELWDRYQREATTFVVELAIVPNIPSPEAVDAFVVENPEAIERAFLERPWLHQLPPQASARIIRVNVPEDAPDEEAESARQRLADARSAVPDEGFEAVARRVSEGDSAQEGGGVGWIVRAQYPELYDTPTGDLSPIFRDRYGFYFGEITARQEGRQRELDDRLSRELAGELLRRSGPQPDSMSDAVSLLASIGEGSDPAEAAAELQIQWVTTPPFRAAGTDVVPHVGQAPDLVDAIVNDLDEPGDLLESPVHVRAGIVVARLVSRTPPNRLDFERERDRFARQMQDLDQRDAWERFVEEFEEHHPSQVRIERLRAELIEIAEVPESSPE